MIIDFHTHIHPPEIRANRTEYLKRDSTFRALYSDSKIKLASIEDLLNSMELNGVDLSVIMGVGWSDLELAKYSNDYIAESVRRYPEKLIGFASVNPSWGEIAAVELERCVKVGLKGVGELHPDTQGFDLRDPGQMVYLMDVVQKNDLILTVHSSEPVGHLYQGKGHTSPEILWRFIQKYPSVNIVCSHWGGGLPFYALMPEVREGLSNVYFDTAASPFLYSSQIFQIVSQLVGSKRMLLGSDFPLIEAGRVLNQIKHSSLTSVEKKDVSGGTALNLLRALITN